MLCCASCGEVIIKDSGSGVKIRTKVLVVNAEEAYAVCKQCGTEIPIPIALDMSRMNDVLTSAKLRLFVHK